MQLEFASLARHGSHAELRAKAERVFEQLDTNGPPAAADGSRLWPIHLRPDTGRTSGNTVTFGAMGDSYYEYLLKYWLFTGKKHERYKRMYLESMRGMISRLIMTQGSLTFVAELKSGVRRRPTLSPLPRLSPHALALRRTSHRHAITLQRHERKMEPSALMNPPAARGSVSASALITHLHACPQRLERKMDHLVCFVPGMLALGAQHIPGVCHVALPTHSLRARYSSPHCGTCSAGGAPWGRVIGASDRSVGAR